MATAVQREDSGTGKVFAGVVGGAGAGALAAVLLRAKTPPPGGTIVTLDPAVLDLLAAIAAGVADNTTQLKALIDKLSTLSLKGYPANLPAVIIDSIVCDTVNKAFQLPDIDIPDGFQLVIKAWPGPTNPPGSFIYVGWGPAAPTRMNFVWPLVPNESISWGVQNASGLWVSSNTIGAVAGVTVELAV